MRNRMRGRRLAWFLTGVLLVGVGCSRHHLGKYTFAEQSLALVYIERPNPQLLSGWHNVGRAENPVQAVLQAGAGVAKEVEARRASARLDTAARRVNVAEAFSERTLDRASRYLGTNVVATRQQADFLLEIHMRRFGIDARSNNATYLYTNAEAVLIDRRTGREIWSTRVRGTRRVTAWVRGPEPVPGAIIAAATLHVVSVEDFEHALGELIAFSSDLITDELRAGLRKVRR